MTKSIPERKCKPNKHYTQKANPPAPPVMPECWNNSSGAARYSLTCNSGESEIDATLQGRGVCLGEYWLPYFMAFYGRRATKFSEQTGELDIPWEQFKSWTEEWMQHNNIIRAPTRPIASPERPTTYSKKPVYV